MVDRPNLSNSEIYGLMQSMNPKNRLALCWVLILIWLTPVFLGQIFIMPSSGPQVDGVVEVLADGTVVVKYAGPRIGFPLRFVEITEYSNGDTTREYHVTRGILNAVLVIFNLIGIVVVIQKSSWQFSIRALMLSTAVLALLIVLAESSNFSSDFVLKAAYFTPLIIGGIIALLNLPLRSHREDAIARTF